MMNIMFFLTPKSEVACVYERENLRQVLEKLESSRFTAVPLLTTDGRYIGTVTEGDLLWKLKGEDFPSMRRLENMSISSVKRNRDNQPVNVHASMEGLLEKIIHQNFVPVVDDDRTFIGIITRQDVLTYLSVAYENQAQEIGPLLLRAAARAETSA